MLSEELRVSIPRNLDLEVVFTDFQDSTQVARHGLPHAWSLTDWQRETLDAGVDYIFVVNREIIDIWQRNSNASCNLLRKMTEARSMGKIVELQTGHLSNQLSALVGQIEELAAISARAAMTFLRQIYLAGWQSR